MGSFPDQPCSFVLAPVSPQVSLSRAGCRLPHLWRPLRRQEQVLRPLQAPGAPGRDEVEVLTLQQEICAGEFETWTYTHYLIYCHWTHRSHFNGPKEFSLMSLHHTPVFVLSALFTSCFIGWATNKLWNGSPLKSLYRSSLKYLLGFLFKLSPCIASFKKAVDLPLSYDEIRTLDSKTTSYQVLLHRGLMQLYFNDHSLALESSISNYFYQERLLRNHMRQHVHQYKCRQCDMTVPTPSALAQHVAYRHSDEKNFPCKETGDAILSLVGWFDLHY